MNEPCPFSCTNKTEFGYCKTTACLYVPTIRVTSMPRTNYDLIISKTPEKLAEWLEEHCYQKGWLEWLRKEADK